MISLFNETDIIKTELLPALVNDYISGKGNLFNLHKYPFSFSSFAQVISDKQKDNTDRKLLVDVLQKQYALIPTTDSVSQNIELLLLENTFTITASHQPCLLLGPLYNIYKISSAIHVAGELKKAFPKYNFVPVFWMGSEDHDIEELNHVYINGKKIEWANAGSGAVGRLNTKLLQPVIEELKTLTGNEKIISILQEGLEKHSTFGKLTQYFTNDIFKEHGLVVLDQDSAALKRNFAGVIEDEILNSTASNLLKSNIEFLEVNYKVQAKPRDINMFYLGYGFRERIVKNSETGKYEVINKSLSFTRDEIVAEIKAHPENFSPNVILRPLYQETILPNLAFIGGAGELSYWLELKPIFEHYKVNYPMQVLRTSAAIINPNIQKKLEKLNLAVSDFTGDVEQLINRYVKDNVSPEVYLNGEKKEVEKIFDALSDKAMAVDITLKQNIAAEKKKVIAALENIEAKILKAEKRKQETQVSQIRSIHTALFPENTPQERKESFIPFYSDSFIKEVIGFANPFKKSFITFLSE